LKIFISMICFTLLINTCFAADVVTIIRGNDGFKINSTSEDTRNQLLTIYRKCALSSDDKCVLKFIKYLVEEDYSPITETLFIKK